MPPGSAVEGGELGLGGGVGAPLCGVGAADGSMVEESCWASCTTWAIPAGSDRRELSLSCSSDMAIPPLTAAADCSGGPKVRLPAIAKDVE